MPQLRKMMTLKKISKQRSEVLLKTWPAGSKTESLLVDHKRKKVKYSNIHFRNKTAMVAIVGMLD
jgi:hypothetical protein